MTPPTIAIIPARGGSVRMPGKNVAIFMGQPLIHWTVRAALDSGVVDRVFVSTDDPTIAQAGRAAGAEVPYLRPAELATSSATTYDAIAHMLDHLSLHTARIGLLQPTSPLRHAQDVRLAFDMMTDRQAPGVVSVCTFDTPWPVLRCLDAAGQLRLVDEPAGGVPTHQLNGALYLCTEAILRRTRSFTPPGTLPYVMPANRSVDIDTPLDFQIAHAIASTLPAVFASPAPAAH
jgi:CMP-N,N'-diacetyllegionaminic acid synthase